jgi:pyruvate dehydrogenase E1 component beta subunit
VLADAQGNLIPDGNHQLTLKLYDVATNGVSLYTETQTVPVVKGIFNVIIGSNTPLPQSLNFDRAYFLGVSVNSGNELAPRTTLTAVPYALRAERANIAESLSPNATGVVTNVNGQSGQLTMQGAGGTTTGLAEKYPQRVLDTPTSEAALTGLAVGAALSGLRPIVHHDRVEFSLLATDQMFTQAGKWNYMFGGGNPVPLTVRIVVGRQWGNGPQHSQALYSMYGAVRGLKVVIPSTPRMAKGLLIAAVRDPNPTIILEPRWLYQIKQDVPTKMYNIPLEKAQIVHKGEDITVVAYGDGLVDSLRSLELVGNAASVEIIDLVSINPVDRATIRKSVAKTGRLLCVDTTSEAFGVGSEIVAGVMKTLTLKQRPVVVAAPNVPCPTSTALTEFWYPTRVDIANAILRVLKKPPTKQKLSFADLHLAPSITLP